MLSLKKLLALGVKRHAKSPLLAHTKVFGLESSKTYRLSGKTITLEPGKVTRKYVQKVLPADIAYEGPLYLAKGIKVSCSCPDFKYRCDYALHRLGASNLKYAHDVPPRETNPNMAPMICRHLTVVLAKIISKKI